MESADNSNDSLKRQARTKWTQEGQPCYLTDDQKERQDLIMFMTRHRLERPVWRMKRPPYLIPETVTITDAKDEMCEGMVEGSVRSGGWRAGREVHITGYGDFLCTLLDDKYESEHLDALMDEDMREHTQSIHGPLLMEQVEEQEKDLVHRVKRMIRVSEGTSAYQAAWMDSEEGESGERSSDDDQEMDIGDDVGMETASEMIMKMRRCFRGGF